MTPMLIAVLTLLSIVVAPGSPAYDRVDLVELNHYRGENAERICDQLIFWDWNDARGRFEVRGWTLLEREYAITKAPHVAADGSATVRYCDDQNIDRVVRGAIYCETWTQDDPEKLDRKRLEDEGGDRLELARRNVPKISPVTTDISP